MAVAALADDILYDRRYPATFCGHCLGEWLEDGTELIIDPTMPILPLDVVFIVLKPEAGNWSEFMNTSGGGFMGVAKYFLGTYEAGETVYMFGQLAPPCVAVIPESAIEAMHSVIEATGCKASSSEDDAKAFEMLRAFCNGEAREPINLTWLDRLLEQAEGSA